MKITPLYHSAILFCAATSGSWAWGRVPGLKAPVAAGDGAPGCLPKQDEGTGWGSAWERHAEVGAESILA